MAKGKGAQWGLRLSREGLNIEAGRHLRLSMSLTLLFWLVSLSSAITSSAYWAHLVA